MLGHFSLLEAPTKATETFYLALIKLTNLNNEKINNLTLKSL